MAISHPLTHSFTRRCRRAWLCTALLTLLIMVAHAASWAGATRVASAPKGDGAPVISALWVSAAGSYYRDETKLDPFIQDLRGMPFTELLLQVRASGDAYYDSQLAPRALGLSERLDPLAKVLKAMHGRTPARRVIAWISPYPIGNANRTAPVDASHVLMAHPDWLSLRADGSKTDAEGNMYLEPALPEVQQHLEAIVRELAQGYAVDGIYFDPICDPGADWGFHPAAIGQWQQRTGNAGQPKADDPSWVSYRAEVLGQALAGMTRAAREVKPKLTLAMGARTDGPAPASMAAFTQSAVYTQFHQDWPKWMGQASGLDRVYLKDFRPESSGARDFNGWMKGALELGQASPVSVVIGVAGTQNESVDALAQLRRAAEAGARGLALADYEQPVRDSGSRALFLSAIGRTVFSPEYLTTMASIAQSRRDVLKSAPASETAETSAPATTAALKSALADTPITPDNRPIGVGSDPTAKLTGASGDTAKSGSREPLASRPASGDPAAELKLPPPPGEIAAVPDEDGSAPPVEEADGRLLPAKGASHATHEVAAATGRRSQEEIERELTLKSLKQLAGIKDGDGGAAPKAAPSTASASGASTQREMVGEMLSSSGLAENRQWNVLRPDQQARDYLKKQFGNIF